LNAASYLVGLRTSPEVLMFRIVLAAAAWLACTVAVAAEPESALDRFSSADRIAIEKAAPNFVREVSTGRLWDLTILKKYRQLEALLTARTPLGAEDDREVDLLGIPRPRVAPPTQSRPGPVPPPSSRFKVHRLAFARAWDGHNFEELVQAQSAEARLGNTLEPAEPLFAKVKVIQALSEQEALVTGFVWNQFAKQRVSDRAMVEIEEPVRLRGFAPGVDGDEHRGIYAELDAEPYVYANALGARRTVRSFSVITPVRITRSTEVAAEELAAAILAGNAKLTQWRQTRATGPKGEDGKPTVIVEWLPEDITPRPMVPGLPK
jgi:hypothetical protein